MSEPSATLTQPTLACHLLPSVSGSLAGKVFLVISGSILLWLSAKISVPFMPVNMTMQLFVVLAMALALGGRLAAAAVLVYLAQGASGLPVFTDTPAKGIGFAYMIGPTGGYLAGFLVAAGLTGWLADRGWSRNPVHAVAAAAVGAVAVYVLGLAWLGTLVGWDKPVLAWGLYPFLVPDLVKVALAGLIVSGTWNLVKRDN